MSPEPDNNGREVIDTNSTYFLFPSLYSRRRGSRTAIYHPLSQAIITVETRDFERWSLTSLHPQHSSLFGPDFQELLRYGIVVDASFNLRASLAKTAATVQAQQSPVGVAYMLVSDQCNLACRYCFVLREQPVKSASGLMSREVATSAIAFLRKNLRGTREAPARVIFYGGEPLLNREILAYCISELRDAEADGAFNGGLTLSLVTNGTTVDKAVSTLLKSNNVQVAVSIDGPPTQHDSMRIDSCGKGSGECALRGFEILKEAGCAPSLSCTLGPHNSADGRTLATYLVGLAPSGVGFNFLLNSDIDQFREQSRAAVDAFKIFRSYGVPEDRIIRRLRALVANHLRPHDCAGCGQQVVIGPQGDIGICHAYYYSRKYFFGNVLDPSLTIPQGLLRRWRCRTPFAMPGCFECPWISLCGGGCAYEAERVSGNMDGCDPRYRIHCKDLMDWVLDEILGMEENADTPIG